jgi:hypothetical protein
LFAFAAAALSGLGIAPVRGDLVLATEGTAACPVVVEKRHEEAGKALADYLKRISGAPFRVTVTNAIPAGKAILVGNFGSTAMADLPGDSFRIDVTGERLQISGATPAGVRFGVFAFLEDRLGCRWWSWDEEDVPRQATIALAEGSALTKAVFTQTILMNQEAQTKRNAFEDKARVKNAEAWSGGHTLNTLLGPYGKGHPEIYPFSKKTGKRAPNSIHFCYSATGIAEAVAEALTEEVKKRNGDTRNVIYMAGMGDWYGGQCECARCEAIYLEEGWTATNGVRRGIIGGTNLRMINRAAEILEGRFPGVKVGTMAYMSMEAPPTLTQPRSNLYVRIPHLRHCIIHGLAECPKNAGCFANVRKWAALAPGRVHIWDYGVNFGENFLYPFPVITAISRNIQLYAKLNLAGLIVQGNYVSTGGDLAVLKNYVWRKILWNPAREPADLIKEFCDGYYGPAAAPIIEYVTELEKAVVYTSTNSPHMDEFAKRDVIRRIYLSKERMQRLRDLAADARAKAAGAEPFARRVEEAVVSLDAYAIWYPGPLAEKDGRLVRTDLGDQYTYDRAKAVCLYSRKASAKEWGPYPNYHKQLLSLQGGPLVVLTNGEIEVAAAPALGMRIRQIRFRGKGLLAVPADPKAKGWPNLGGASEAAFPGWTTGEVAGQPSSTGLVMRTEAGSGTTLKHLAEKTIVLGDNGAIRIGAASERVTRDPDYTNTRCNQLTAWQVGRKTDQFSVEARAPDGWTPLAFASSMAAAADPTKKTKTVEAVFPEGTSALRITLKGAGCVAEDWYEEPALLGGKAVYDPAAGVLTTSMETKSVPTVLNEKRKWLERTLFVRELK